MGRAATPWPERLARFRRRRNWTQVRAATEYGVRERTWRRWENGEVPVPLPVQRWVLRSRLPKILRRQ